MIFSTTYERKMNHGGHGENQGQRKCSGWKLSWDDDPLQAQLAA
jgi:hypothetical protein